MGKYDAVELHGAKKAGYVGRCLARIKRWGLTMPDVDPLALHFGLDKFEEIGEIEFWIANETKEGYCGKFLFVFDGQTCPYHHHAKKHETFYIVKGKVGMRIGDSEREMREGDHLATPPGTGHSFTGIGDALLIEVSSPSVLQDNFFEDKNIGDNGVI